MLMGVCDGVVGRGECLACRAAVSRPWNGSRPYGGVHCWGVGSLLGSWQSAFAWDWDVVVCLQCMCGVGVGVRCTEGCCMEELVWVVDEDGLWNYWLGSYLSDNWNLHKYDQEPPLSSIRFRVP